MTHPSYRSRRAFALGVAVLIGLGIGPVRPAAAAPASSGAVRGYLRVAHLSPDAPDLDVSIDAAAGDGGASGAGAARRLAGLRYGVLSGYLPLPPGSYAVSVRVAGAPATSRPLLVTTVVVEAGRAYTVAGVGRRVDLGLRVVDDDLGLAGTGGARIRVIPASIRWPRTDVSIPGGTVLAAAAPFASIGRYQDVEPGRLALRVAASGSAAAIAVEVSLQPGGVYSLVVLDSASGTPTAELHRDAMGVAEVPVGGVGAGGGGAGAAAGDVGAALGAVAGDALATVAARARGAGDGSVAGDRDPATPVAGESTTAAGPPVRLQIPAIALDARLVALRTGRQGVLVPPADNDLAGWYEGGPLPGEAGPAVIAGHVDSAAAAAVFYRLAELAPGDEVRVERGGRWFGFRVVAVGRYPKVAFPTRLVYGATPDAQLRLITCGGTFDRGRGSYRDNVVVSAVADGGSSG